VNLLRTELIGCQNCACLALATAGRDSARGAGFLGSGTKLWFSGLCEMRCSLIWTTGPGNRSIAVEPPFAVSI
jgi:hypothetical protein